jgi:transcriptional regulator GlxA family with amidase domain
MGGDFGPSVTLPACRNFLASHPDAHLVLVGLQQSLADFSYSRITKVFASEVVEMDDALEIALRKKKDSSMRVAIEQVRDGLAQAAVSAGNTGALMAIARYVLKTLEGIERPALAGQIPNAKGHATTVLDLGANVDCTPLHLLQFAVMGSALVSVTDSLEVQTVSLVVRCTTRLADETKPATCVFLNAMEGDMAQAIADNPRWVAWLRQQYDGGAVLASNCTGAFVLAATGLLDDQPATLAWFAVQPFRAAFPTVRVFESELLVDNGQRIISSGATTSYLNLAVYVIEKLAGPELAALLAKYMVIDKGKAPQNSYAMLNSLKAHPDTAILRAQVRLENDTQAEVSIAHLAEELALSERTLLRRFKQATGISPAEYRQRIRIEAAKRLLENGQSSIKEIGYGLGYEDLPHFRSVFKRVSGVTPSEYRQQHTFRMGVFV